MKKLTTFSFTALLLFYSCAKTEIVSPVPHITFESFELFNAYDSLLGNNIKMGELKFKFIDGDADIGIKTSVDSTKPNTYNYNIFLYPYQKVNGSYLKIDFDTSITASPPFYRISYDSKLGRVGQDKVIKGTIKLDIPYYVTPSYDTIRYLFYILDRSMNKSNTDSTTDIAFN
jgi:hypothetical protein